MGHGKREDEWRDSNVRVRGPAVRAMQQAFAENWVETGGALLPAESFPDIDTAGKVRAALVASAGSGVVTKGDRLMQLLIAAAHSRLWISNAYFTPSEPIIKLLAEKARQGVDVRVLMAGDNTDMRVVLPDQRARVARLLPEGVRAFEYAPTMMHSKTVLVDDAIFAVGSQNLDALSLNKMDEVTLVAEDRERAAELAKAFEKDLTRSLEVKLPKDKRQRVSVR
jgi:cardiolipin synthase